MISTTIASALVMVGGTRVHIPVEITLTFDVDYDPFAIHMIIEVPGEPDVIWQFDRALLAQGMQSVTSVGDGDIKLRHTEKQDHLLACLSNILGHADLALPYAAVSAFLDETLHEVPLGFEHSEEHIDELIEEILNG